MTPEQIAAFVDDELDEPARAQVAEAALRDPALAARIAAERRLRETLRTHFAPIVAEPVPHAWVAAIRSATAGDNVVDLAQARAGRARPQPLRGWVGGAIAASLVLGVMIGAQLHRPALFVAGPNGLIASGALAHTLDTQLAAAQADAPTRILGTFRRQGGALCRVFAGPAASGIACHGDGGWQMQRVVPGTNPESGAYRQAGSAQADLMAAAQAMAVGEPFTADQERAARQHGWH